MPSFSSTYSIVPTRHICSPQILVWNGYSREKPYIHPFCSSISGCSATRTEKFDQIREHPKPYLNVWIKNFAHFMIIKKIKKTKIKKITFIYSPNTSILIKLFFLWCASLQMRELRIFFFTCKILRNSLYFTVIEQFRAPVCRWDVPF